jgi:cyclohexa-1,5-dienecarbonyl-CoA hydratase
VRGQCLGGGLELAAFCHRVFAAPDATLGQPEVKLGVFAPVASLVLPLRIGQAAADDLLLTGRTVGGEEALALGLVDELAEDPAGAARAWHRARLRPLSAVALAFAARASRHQLDGALGEGLAHLERLYLEELMATRDAREGIEAFLERRSPTWSHR